ETLELVRAYYRINDVQVRKRLFELAKALGSIEPVMVASKD
ncbi:MAG: helix-turn-helix domain-containing protein, partial [Geminicoccaceae bacterium]